MAESKLIDQSSALGPLAGSRPTENKDNYDGTVVKDRHATCDEVELEDDRGDEAEERLDGIFLDA